MLAPRWFSPKRLTPAHQALLVVKVFPVFDWAVEGNQCILQGNLRPTGSSERYHITIQYRPDSIPAVFIADLEASEDIPHLYSDGSLCLFHPGVFNWHGRRTLLKYIVPWTASWLLFYEKWKELGVWLGPEVPHSISS